MPPRIPFIVFSHRPHPTFAKNCVRTTPLPRFFTDTPKHRQDDRDDSATPPPPPPSPSPAASSPAAPPNEPSSFLPPSTPDTTLKDQIASYAATENFSSSSPVTAASTATTATTTANSTTSPDAARASTNSPSIRRYMPQANAVPAYQPAQNYGNQNYPSSAAGYGPAGYGPASPGGGSSGSGSGGGYSSGGYTSGYYGGVYGGANPYGQTGYPSAQQQQQQQQQQPPPPTPPYSPPISLFSGVNSRGNANAGASASGLSDTDNEELFRSQRRFRHGEMYTPKDLSFESFRDWRKRKAPSKDAFDVLGLNPLDEYKNFNLLSEYTTEMGRIKGRSETGLRPVNQRRVAKAIRRAVGIGLLPSTHKHPELLKKIEDGFYGRPRFRQGGGFW